MLYKLGTVKELLTLECPLPDRVRTEIYMGLMILDIEYGERRNYLESGGYSIIVENKSDIPALKKILDFDSHPCEWATQIHVTGYLSALFVINDDFSIMVYMPISIAPNAILQDLEE